MLNELPSTFREMCETIAHAHFLIKKNGSYATAEEIFNYSPTGELWMIFHWYEVAIFVNSKRTELKQILYDMATQGSLPGQTALITQKLDDLFNKELPDGK